MVRIADSQGTIGMAQISAANQESSLEVVVHARNDIDSAPAADIARRYVAPVESISASSWVSVAPASTYGVVSTLTAVTPG